MIISDDFVIKCDFCGREYEISPDTLDVDYAYDERGMGTEIQYIFYGETECQCGEVLRYRITAVEYPVGAYNFHESESENCSFVTEPQAEMDYLPEPVMSVFEQILYDPGSAYSLEPWEFEQLVAEVFQRNGFHAEVTQKTRDDGRDVVATFEKGGVLYRTYLECKRYSPNRPVGVNVVRDLFAVMDRDRIDKGVIVTTSYFTRDAMKEGERFNGRIQLIDFEELQRLMRR